MFHVLKEEIRLWIQRNDCYKVEKSSFLQEIVYNFVRSYTKNLLESRQKIG